MAILRLNKLLACSAIILSAQAAIVGNSDPTTNQGLLGDLVGMPLSNLTSAGSLLRAWLLHQGSAIGPDNPVSLGFSVGFSPILQKLQKYSLSLARYVQQLPRLPQRSKLTRIFLY